MAKNSIELIARGLLIEREAVLLCGSVSQGYWYLPGGHVDFGESAEQALAREFAEEAALEVTVGPLVLVSENRFAADRPRHEVNLVFHVERSSSGIIASLEAAIEFRWHALANLDTIDLRPASVKAWLMAGGARAPTANWLTADDRPDQTPQID